MTTAIKDAETTLTSEFIRALREGDGCLPEADSELNDASRVSSRQ